MMVDDILLIGSKFTWYSSNGTSRSRIDIALMTSEWLEICNGCTQYILDRNISDHCPILIKKNSIIDCGPKPFRVLGCWLNVKYFSPLG